VERIFTNMTNYKLIQLTNNSLGAVAVNQNIPLGTVTRRINAPYNCCNTFTVTTSANDTVVLNDVGFYKVTYSLTATAAAAGEVTTNLVVNGVATYGVTQTIVDEANAVNSTLVYTIRVTSDKVPATVQLQNVGIALTGETANLIIEKF
jgi:hypothetical protein